MLAFLVRDGFPGDIGEFSFLSFCVSAFPEPQCPLQFRQQMGKEKIERRYFGPERIRITSIHWVGTNHMGLSGCMGFWEM